MNSELEELLADLGQPEMLPTDQNCCTKVKCELRPGTMISWYFEDELKFWKQDGLDPREYAQWMGVIVPAPNIEYRGGLLEIEHCVVVMYYHPCEKDYPETGWKTLGRLLENLELVEIFELKKS